MAFPSYQVSDAGLVRRAVENHKLKRHAILVPGDTGRALHVTLYANGIRATKKIHHLVAVAFLPKAPSVRHMIAHNDGSHRNNKVENLRWATCKENLADRIRHSTELRGERNGRAKLTAAKVLEIRSRYTPRCPVNGAKALALEMGVTDVAVIKAFRGENWSQLPAK